MLKLEDTEHFLLRSIQILEHFNNNNKIDLSFTPLDTKEQVNILLYGYPPNTNLIALINQWLVVYIVFSFFLFFCCCCLFCLYAYGRLLFLFLKNNCKFVAYNWLQSSYINTLLLLNSSLLFLLLFVTNYNLQTLNVLCSSIISVWLIINVEPFGFLCFLFSFSCISCL